VDDPKVPDISRVSQYRTWRRRIRASAGRRIRWYTEIEFNNGVILKFSGKVSDEDARREANRYYLHCLEGGITQEEMIALFKPEPEPEDVSDAK
jgi:hypothetical protein